MDIFGVLNFIVSVIIGLLILVVLVVVQRVTRPVRRLSESLRLRRWPWPGLQGCTRGISTGRR